MNFQEVFKNAQETYDPSVMLPTYADSLQNVLSTNNATKTQDKIKGVSTAAIGAGLSLTPLAPLAPLLAPLGGNLIGKLGADADTRRMNDIRFKEDKTTSQNNAINNYAANMANPTTQQSYFKLGGTPYGNYEAEAGEIVLGDANINGTEVTEGMTKVQGKKHEQGGEQGQGGDAIITDTLAIPDELITALVKSRIKVNKGATFAQAVEAVGKEIERYKQKEQGTTDTYRRQTIKNNLQKLEGLIGTIGQTQEMMKASMGVQNQNEGGVPNYELGQYGIPSYMKPETDYFGANIKMRETNPLYKRTEDLIKARVDGAPSALTKKAAQEETGVTDFKYQDNTTNYNIANLGNLVTQLGLIKKTPQAAQRKVAAPQYSKANLINSNILNEGYATGLASLSGTSSLNRNANATAMLRSYIGGKTAIGANNMATKNQVENYNNTLSNNYRGQDAAFKYQNELANNNRTAFINSALSDALGTATTGFNANNQIAATKKADFTKTILNLLGTSNREGINEDVIKALTEMGYGSVNKNRRNG